MKKQSDSVISSNIPTLNIDSETLTIIQKIFPNPKNWKPPKGFVSLTQIQKITNRSRSTLFREIRKLKKQQKVEIIQGFSKSINGKSIILPFYRFKI